MSDNIKIMHKLPLLCIISAITINIILSQLVSLPNIGSRIALNNKHDISLNSTIFVSRTGTVEQLNIRTGYIFTTPQLEVNCNREYLKNNASHAKDIIIYRSKENADNIACEAICYLSIKADKHSKLFTAIKINQNNQMVLNQITFEVKSQFYTFKIPRTIQKLIISDDVLVRVVENQQIPNPLGGYNWFYADEQLKNLRTTQSINEVKEYNVQKLGWFQRGLTDTEFSFNATEVENNFKLENHNCNDFNFQYEFNAVHYFNPNHLLQKAIEGESIQQISQIPIDDVNVDLNSKILTVNYRNSLSKSIQISLLDWKDGFRFSAVIILDRFANYYLSLNITENFIGQVIIEIGVPGTPVYAMTVHHNGFPNVYKCRLSDEIKGDQWVCAHPSSNSSKETCRFVTNNQYRFVKPLNRMLLSPTKQSRTFKKSKTNAQLALRRNQINSQTNSSNSILPNIRFILFISNFYCFIFALVKI